MALNIMDNELI